MSAHDSTLLRVQDLSVRHVDGTVLVDNASFEVTAGRRVGIVGESGSGKSLTLKSIIGLLSPELKVCGGVITIDGQAIDHTWPPSQAARLRGTQITYINQDASQALNPSLRIEVHLTESLPHGATHSRRGRRARAKELLAAVGLTNPDRVLRAYPHQLSGGQKQRVLIAAALAGEPRLMLCDEPTTALDTIVQRQILDLLIHLCDDQDVSLLFASHDLPVIAESCHVVVGMYAGRTVESGPTAALLANPQHPYTEALIGALPTDKNRGELQPIPGEVADVHQPPKGCRFHPRCSDRIDSCTVTPHSLLPSAHGAEHLTACIRRQVGRETL
jgi:oligopeptide/dipeptide ABC transporter ATP-binding protein